MAKMGVRETIPGTTNSSKKTKKGNVSRKKYIWIGLGVLVAIYLWWLIFLSYDQCDSWDCFNEHLESCNRAIFLGGDGIIFEYIIEGSLEDSCQVNVKLLQGELNVQDSRKLENLEMVCSLPLGVVMVPESDIGNCHGLLKEGLQNLVIEKLHTYLVQNVGRINLELLNITQVL